ncbi:hypothetical protein [Chryseobacterium sp. SC28]|uniref:hypothetical protein n=1 Tax=Chryseobacterium sp. SC28 TaxID=2268028 RepID=UPI0016276252|nr:hypothetical protein [Chryseobacterium sp. SC28]
MSKEELEANNYTRYNTSTMQDYDIDAECVGVDAVGVGVATINAFSDLGITV